MKELERIIPNRGKLLVLEKLLNEAYLIRRPKPSEYEHRKQLIRVFNEIARELYGKSPLTFSTIYILHSRFPFSFLSNTTFYFLFFSLSRHCVFNFFLVAIIGYIFQSRML